MEDFHDQVVARSRFVPHPISASVLAAFFFKGKTRFSFFLREKQENPDKVVEVLFQNVAKNIISWFPDIVFTKHFGVPPFQETSISATKNMFVSCLPLVWGRSTEIRWSFVGPKPRAKRRSPRRSWAF